ncbi:MAG: aldehyde dehydrogenase family protein, partial [Alphaproteobacteria bacterium]|nr:aldehyde dehydrogenase family protein [Alphaproteobacteria bacterium]
MKTLLKDPGLWREAALIDGQWVSETPHGASDLINPASGDLLARLPRCKEEETTRAVVAADNAFRRWRKTTAKHRSQILYRWWQLIMESKEDLATLITLEEGKPLSEARGEIDYAA